MRGCLVCGEPASFVLHPLELVACQSHCGEWLRERECAVDVVCSALGISAEPTRHDKRNTARFDAELLRRTEAWAARLREEWNHES